MEENLEHIESRLQEMYGYELDLAFIEDKLIDLEDRARRNNLKVDGIKRRPNETWEECEKELETLFKESQVIEKEVLKRHRVKTDKRKKCNTPGSIV